eukprot:s1350_g13.t1
MTMLEAQKLRGRMQFMDGQLLGRLGRLCMKAVSDHAFSKGGSKLDTRTLDALKRFTIFLEHAGPRQLRLTSKAVWFVYKDALTWEQINFLGALQKQTIIFEAELLALVLAFALWKEKLMAQWLVCFVDNYSARDVAISGSGRNDVARSLIDFLLKLEMATSSTPWYGRVPTPSNVADEPSPGVVHDLLSVGVQQDDPAQVLDQVLEVFAGFRLRWGFKQDALLKCLAYGLMAV